MIKKLKQKQKLRLKKRVILEKAVEEKEPNSVRTKLLSVIKKFVKKKKKKDKKEKKGKEKVEKEKDEKEKNKL